MSDELRDELAQALSDCYPCYPDLNPVNALLPIIERRIAQARADTTEQIAVAMDDEAEKHPPGLGSYRSWWRNVARMARQHAGKVGSDE